MEVLFGISAGVVVQQVSASHHALAPAATTATTAAATTGTTTARVCTTDHLMLHEEVVRHGGGVSDHPVKIPHHVHLSPHPAAHRTPGPGTGHAAAHPPDLVIVRRRRVHEARVEERGGRGRGGGLSVRRGLTSSVLLHVVLVESRRVRRRVRVHPVVELESPGVEPGHGSVHRRVALVMMLQGVWVARFEGRRLHNCRCSP